MSHAAWRQRKPENQSPALKSRKPLESGGGGLISASLYENIVFLRKTIQAFISASGEGEASAAANGGEEIGEKAG